MIYTKNKIRHYLDVIFDGVGGSCPGLLALPGGDCCYEQKIVSFLVFILSPVVLWRDHFALVHLYKT